LKDVGNITEADNRAELIKEFRTSPEAVVILDYTLFDFSGAEELLILTERFPKANWILFSDELSEEFVKRILYSSQQFSFVMKDNSKEEITSALQCAMHKERFICNHISNMLIGKQHSVPVENILTNTEKIILKEIALGKTTKEIAAERFSSVHTITTHRKNIFRKLEVNTVYEATKYALRAGIIDSAEYYI